jgi:hypothetical protein
MAVWIALLGVFTCWLCVPVAFRRQRPELLRHAMGVLVMGVFAAALPMCGVQTMQEAEVTLEVALRCAEALTLLMVFDLIAYVRRPSSMPVARVTHGA